VLAHTKNNRVKKVNWNETKGSNSNV
jgi:hypothetical protein